LPSLQALVEDRQLLRYEQQGKHISYYSVTEVQFERDLSRVVTCEDRGPSEAEILMKFFEFYGFIFDREKYAIDIRSGNLPYPLRDVVLEQVKDKFSEHPRG